MRSCSRSGEVLWYAAALPDRNRWEHRDDSGGPEPIGSSARRIAFVDLLPKRNVHGELVAIHINHITEGAFAAPREIQTHAAIAHAQIANVQVVKPVGQ